jgi:hypothetical protein
MFDVRAALQFDGSLKTSLTYCCTAVLGIGNVSFTSCEVDDSVARPWLSATAGFTDVSATKMVVRNKYGCTTAGLAVQAQCEP